MSEGINFSDHYGRCVIVVGLPFPNAQDPVFREKLKFIVGPEQEHQNPLQTAAGRAYYETVCMKAVNQSIGRSIRHKNDYSVILLVDGKYLFWHMHHPNSLMNIQSIL